MKKTFKLLVCLLAFGVAAYAQDRKTPVDYVNPNMGNISHLLVPTYPFVHLPNSMLRVYPMRESYTETQIDGLPVVLTNDRGSFAFHFCPFQGETENLKPVIKYAYDNEQTRPYRYQVDLDELGIHVDMVPSHQSAVYSIQYGGTGVPSFVVSTDNGQLKLKGQSVSGYQWIDDKTKIFLYTEFNRKPSQAGALADGRILSSQTDTQGKSAAIALAFGRNTTNLTVRYGISFISAEQAEKNLRREVKNENLDALANAGRKVWNNALSRITVEGGSDDDKTIFYTSMYRCMQRPILMNEDGRYYSGFDHSVHDGGGHNFYTDDWIWDTYRATHPLRVLTDAKTENDILNSYLLMAKQMGNDWMPTFPSTVGDHRWMNCNHAVATMLDAYRKGLRGFDINEAYTAAKKGIEEKSLIPWCGAPAGILEEFYKKHGYIPSLQPGETETVPHISDWEQRQPVAVTLGTAYDEWCLSQIAKEIGNTDDERHYLQCSYNYRNLFNPTTRFFHPKDKDGHFIPDVSYKYVGREYYCENNGYIHRWDIQHNIADLIELLGGEDSFVAALDSLFTTPLGMARWQFYNKMPDHGANVGMFSMANEPCFHIPYLYNYAGQPWKTQKCIRTLLHEWFRNDLMGVPGDEDGGGMSAFVVFSQMGFYPVTPGFPSYNIGSPTFSAIHITLDGGRIFTLKAIGVSAKNKYIQSAKLNGKPLNQAWFNHADMAKGGVLELLMGPRPNKSWGTAVPPPSQGILNK